MNTNLTLAADVVLFAVATDRRRPVSELLQVLMIRRRWEPFADHWALPGGHVDPGERFEQAARRELLEETGIEAPTHLFELGVWDRPDRDPRGRVISVPYFGVAGRLVRPTAADDAAAAVWLPIRSVLGATDLAFDHADILSAAVEQLESLDTSMGGPC